MTKKRVWLRFFLGEVQVFGALHGVLAVVLCAFWPALAGPSLLLFVPVAAMGLARALLPNAFLLLLSHLALAAAPMLLPLGLLPRLAFTALLAVAAVVSLAKRLAAERTERENRETYGRGSREEVERITGDGAAYRPRPLGMAMAVGLLAGLGFAAGGFGVQGTGPWLLGWAAAQVLCWLAARQLENTDADLTHLARATRQPVRRILRMDNALLLGLLALALGVLAVVLVLPVERMGQALWLGVLAVLRALVRLLSRLFSGGAAPEEEPVAEPPAQGGTPELPEAGEPSLLLEILSVILSVAVAVGLAVLLLYGIYRLYRRFGGARGVNSGDEREFLVPAFETSPLDGLLRRLRGAVPNFGTGQRARVRRRYYRTVRRHMRQGAKVRPAQTAGEIEQTLAPREDMAPLTARYNRARYGGPEEQQ